MLVADDAVVELRPMKVVEMGSVVVAEVSIPELVANVVFVNVEL